MKLIAVAFLAVAVLCNSMLAVAEGPVPFRTLMQAAGAQPSTLPIADAKDQSTSGSTQPAHKPPITSGGKTMIGVGIGMMAIGGVVLIGTVALNSWGSSSHKAEAYGTSTGLLAGGVTLIVLGSHRRSAK